MIDSLPRRTLLTSGLLVAATASAPTAAAPDAPPPVGAATLRDLTGRLARAPRRRDFKTVPMILDHSDLWDHEALSELLAYAGGPKQAWNNTAIGGPWLNLMRNALNVQVWSYRHPEFLAVSATHGSAQLALYDAATWDKYGLASLAGETFKSNTLIDVKPAQASNPNDYESPTGAFSGENNSIPALMARGVVFLSCHMAIWEQAAALLKAGRNPDALSHEALAAELTNHLVPGVVLTPGAVGTLPELQRAGFLYAS